MPRSPHPPPRIHVERVEPIVDCGRYAAKRTVGDVVAVRAELIRDGHEILRAVVRARPLSRRRPREAPMAPIDAQLGGSRWEGRFEADEVGPWRFEIEAWADAFASWRDELERKVAAGQEDLAGELAEGAAHLEAAAGRARHGARKALERAHAVLADERAPWRERVAAALAEEVVAAADAFPAREDATVAGPFDLWVDRERARFGAWYELFPRSWGGLRGVAKQIPKLAELGFDVVYLPPVHPIGETNRKGANNALVAGEHDPGSPWAIGDRAHGGHDALHPELGTWEDFDALIAAARRHDVDVALDFAIQCSADHPWLTEHPEWFHHRPDGTLKYAENPPKRYQDIYNVNWDSPDWRGLWKALHDVLMVWVRRGVRVFRVDNPHTKPLDFWEWLIAEVHRTHPDVVFLAEAFTRAATMRTLAKLGFSQSYTYFTWKNSRAELIDYVVELATSGMQEYFRPNFFANTPDILHAYLVDGGPPAFHARLVLAATLSPSYGIYSGFEHHENVPLAPGSEEYLDSEKYELKRRRLDGPLLPVAKRLNRARREHLALQRLDDVWFLDAGHDELIAYAKSAGDDVVIVAVNLDPHHAHEGAVVVPELLDLPGAFAVRDLLSGERYEWRTGSNYVRLEAGGAHVLAVR
ncbi:MAG TPA: maltotransferase domain-containing protein [Solirubrobacteraceae bacterium]|nr:maltotransferase domain-containing protein [Solirubrobacteraceae bacterium]